MTEPAENESVSTTQKVTYVGLGLLLGGILTKLLLKFFPPGRAADEEQPPIIVRSGSLIFQSGDPTSNDGDVVKWGKPWRPVEGNWQPDHANGKAVKWFTIFVQDSTRPCPARTKEVKITFNDSFGDREFVVTTKPRPNQQSGQNDGPDAPAIAGAGLRESTTGKNPTLEYGTKGAGSIKSVEYNAQGGGKVVLTHVTSVTIWP